VLELPEGSRFDESAVPACVASDLELTATIDSCPPATRLGGGSGTVVTGFGPPIDPIAGDFHLYHGSGELIGVGTPPGGRSALTIGRLKIEGSTLVNPSIQPTPGGPPDGETVAAETEVQFPPRVTTAGGIQHAFLSAPDVCPSSGRWTSRLTTTFSDGSAETAATTLPCSPPSLRLWVRPRRTTVGRRTRFRFRVKSASPQCVRGALIRFKGRRVRTDQNGFASLRKRFLHSGRRHARASQTGCGEARARVRVRRR
jgi:hypothetical protein